MAVITMRMDFKRKDEIIMSVSMYRAMSSAYMDAIARRPVGAYMIIRTHVKFIEKIALGLHRSAL